MPGVWQCAQFSAYLACGVAAVAALQAIG